MPALPLRVLVHLVWYVIGRLAELALRRSAHADESSARVTVSLAPAGGPGPLPSSARPLAVRVPAQRRERAPRTH